MARLAMASEADSKPDGSLGSRKDYRYYVTIVFDGFGTQAELTVIAVLFTLYAHLPIEHCLLVLLFAPDEVRQFKTRHKLIGRAGPLVFITEENPFGGSEISQRVVVELGRLKEPDDIKKVLVTIAEQAYDDDFIKRAGRGELLRRIQETLGKYGSFIKDSLSIIGLG
jgi:hypothetical protein